jgi:hypothetical protein
MSKPKRKWFDPETMDPLAKVKAGLPKIKRPPELCRNMLCDIVNGKCYYCANGWLLKELGLAETAQLIGRGSDFYEAVGETAILVNDILASALGINPDNVADLFDINDSAFDEDRVQIFLEWCEDCGIEVYDPVDQDGSNG